MKKAKKTSANAWDIIGRGCASWHAQDGNVSSSGGSLESYASEAPDGAFVYDMDACEYADIVDLVFRGPMVDTNLTGPETRGVAGENTPRSLTFVSASAYMQLVRALPGVRVGRVWAGVAQWEQHVAGPKGRAGLS